MRFKVKQFLRQWRDAADRIGTEKRIKTFRTMRKLIALCVASLAVMHANQDLSPMYWAGLIVFIFAVILMANKLDNGYGKKIEDNKH